MSAKKTAFYGMFLAALLLLLAATAVAAAYLSAQQFVQQEVLPLAQENDADGYEEKFSNQELAEIVRLARENGIALSDEMMAEAVKLVNGRAKLEASGGITLERLPRIGKIGVDFVSAGALTHSVKAADISLDIRVSK